MKPLPIGIQTFEKLRKGGYLYVDKTGHLLDLVRGGYFFLSRPRRFGKSLLISTLEALLIGKKELFEGLALMEQGYGFKKHPVIRLDFSTMASQNPEILERDLRLELERFAREADVRLSPEGSLENYLKELIRAMSVAGPVAILVDEYDKPILDHLDQPDLAVANRDLLRRFYGVLKALDAHIHMVFITGITRFSKVSIFSELNNLLDLSIDPRQSGLLGLTERELQNDLKPHVQALADTTGQGMEAVLRVLEETYNGYRFTHAEQTVYNPWSVLNALYHQRIGNFWYESGSSMYLINELRKRVDQADFDPHRLYHSRIRANRLPSLNIRNADLETLLFQAGYLTIKSTSGALDKLYLHMGFPNHEVEQSWLFTVMKALAPEEDNRREDHLDHLLTALEDQDLSQFFQLLKTAFFANIPYELHISCEKYYQIIFHTLFLLLQVRIGSEISTNIGRIDGALETDHTVYLFELKYNDSAESALRQIKERGYGDKFQATDKKIIGVGVGFANRNISDWTHEMLS